MAEPNRQHVENLQRVRVQAGEGQAGREGRDGCHRGDHAEVQGEGTPAEPSLE